MGDGEAIKGRYTEKMTRLYIWTWPHELIKTVDGPVAASVWMDAEADRINRAAGRMACVVKDRRGCISIEVNEYDTRSYRNRNANAARNPKDRRIK